jgi:hypothetical protein
VVRCTSSLDESEGYVGVKLCSVTPSPSAKGDPPLSFDLYMDDTCPKCRKPLGLAVIEPHATRRDFAVHRFDCADCGRVKTKILFRKQAAVA